MLQQLPRSYQRNNVGLTVPPPTGGWNKRDALDNMDPSDAIKLDNWFPRTNDVVTRNGFTSHCDTGEDNSFVETLAEHHSGATRKLLAGVNGKIYDVTTSTASSLSTGFSENMWQTATFNGRTFFVNGTDAPQDFDGSTLSATSWSGTSLTIANLIDVHAHKNRLYFVEKDTQSFWYGGLNAVTGTLTEFNLAGVGNFGGNIAAIGSVTQDGGDGIDDLLCVFFTSGEVAIYAGDDPAASNWALIGVFRIGSPISRRAIKRFGSDLLVTTRDGYTPLTDVLPFGRSQRRTLSDKIIGEVTEVVQQYADNEGWDIIAYPTQDMLIFNVPRSTSRFDQHVMNTRTGAWCRFRNLNGKCWSLFSDALYFGGANGIVYKADDGASDNGSEIIADGQTAWNYFGDRGSLKRITMARPIFVSRTAPPVAIELAVDYEANSTASAINFSADNDVSVWGEDVWDVARWAGASKPSADWLSVSGVGMVGSFRVRLSSSTQQVRWNSTAYTVEFGQGF